uniref:Uncharacterized protein n=1 Tax=Agrobacterium tumefaciens TaxID=358 RepID=A0A2P0QJR0_AGRTU|nr:hypothetical protein AgrTiChry5_99 [Agrobacterium tumefaciens]
MGAGLMVAFAFLTDLLGAPNQELLQSKMRRHDGKPKRMMS